MSWCQMSSCRETCRHTRRDLAKERCCFFPEKYAGAPTEEVVDKKPRKKKNNNNEDDLISQLWHIFSHYAMRRYPKDVDHISDAMALEFLSRLQILEKFNGKKTLDGSHSSPSTSTLSFDTLESQEESLLRFRHFTQELQDGCHIFTDFRLLGCLADLCSKQVCARPCAHCCASNVRDNITDQIYFTRVWQ